MPITWKKEFAVGVHAIDAQHQELFARLDRLHSAIESGSGAQELTATFKFLDDYVRSHFRAEEELQQRNRYPHFPMHIAEHKIFEAKLEKLHARLEAEGATAELAHLTESILAQWLIQHICRLDKELPRYLEKHKTEEWERWQRDNF